MIRTECRWVLRRVARPARAGPTLRLLVLLPLSDVRFDRAREERLHRSVRVPVPIASIRRGSAL
jgi:hypothetical protein